MQKHFFKFRKVFTNFACSPLLLILNNSELAAKFLPNEVKQSITSLEINNVINGSFKGFNIKQDQNYKSNYDDSIKDLKALITLKE